MTKYNYAAFLVLINSILFGLTNTIQSSNISMVIILAGGATNLLIMLSIIATEQVELIYNLRTVQNINNTKMIIAAGFALIGSFLFRQNIYAMPEPSYPKIIITVLVLLCIFIMCYIIYKKPSKIVILVLGLIVICYVLFLFTMFSNFLSVKMSTFLANAGGSFMLPYVVFFIMTVSNQFLDEHFK